MQCGWMECNMYMYMLQVAADSAPLARVGEREREGATPLPPLPPPPPPPPPSLSSRAESKESSGACWQAAMGGCAATIAVQTAATTIPSSIIMIIINAALQSARLLDKMDDTRNIGTPRPWPSLPPHRLPLSLRSAERCSAAWGSLRHLEPRAAFPAALQRPAAASRPAAFGGGRRREGSPRTCTEQGEWERGRERDRRRRATR